MPFLKALGLVFIVALAFVLFAVLLRGTIFSEHLINGPIPAYALLLQLGLIAVAAFTLMRVLPQPFKLERIGGVLVIWAVVYLTAIFLSSVFGEKLLCMTLLREASPPAYNTLMQVPYLQRACVEGRITAFADAGLFTALSMKILFVILVAALGTLLAMLNIRLWKSDKLPVFLTCLLVLMVMLMAMNIHFLLSIIEVLQNLVKITIDPLKIKLPHYGPMLGTVVPRGLVVVCLALIGLNLGWLFVRLRRIFNQQRTV